MAAAMLIFTSFNIEEFGITEETLASSPFHLIVNKKDFWES
jgi:hypothetical protein